MSVQAMSWVLDHSQAELGSRLVLLAIANHCDAAGRDAFPSQAKLAEEANVSVRSVKRAVAALVELGELSVGHHEGQKIGRGRTNYYELPAFIASLPSSNLAPGEEADQGTSATEPGDICADQGPTVAPQEPSLGTVHEPSSSSAALTDPVIEEDEEILTKLVELKLADRRMQTHRGPVNDAAAWRARTRQAELDDGFVIRCDAAILAHGNPDSVDIDAIARYLFDGTQPPQPPKVFTHDCGAELVGMTAYEDHLTDCDFIPADRIEAEA